MKRDLRGTIGDQLILNSPPPPIPSQVYGICVDYSYV